MSPTKHKVIALISGGKDSLFSLLHCLANGYEIVVFEDMPSQLAAVLSSRVDAAVNDNGVVFDYAKENPTSEVSAEFDTGEQYGLMAKKDDANATALMKVVNEVLTESKSNGAYNDIYKKWFGVDAPN